MPRLDDSIYVRVEEDKKTRKREKEREGKKKEGKLVIDEKNVRMNARENEERMKTCANAYLNRVNGLDVCLYACTYELQARERERERSYE